jgi:hypothetical protein
MFWQLAAEGLPTSVGHDLTCMCMGGLVVTTHPSSAIHATGVHQVDELEYLAHVWLYDPVLIRPDRL